MLIYLVSNYVKGNYLNTIQFIVRENNTKTEALYKSFMML